LKFNNIRMSSRESKREAWSDVKPSATRWGNFVHNSLSSTLQLFGPEGLEISALWGVI